MLIFVNIWVLATLALFYFGPIAWDGARDVSVAVVVLAAMAGLNLGCMAVPTSSHCSYRTVIPLRLVTGKATAYVIIIAFLLLSAHQIHTATGRSFLSPADWSFDFGAVYTEYQERTRLAHSGSTIQSLMSLTKAMLFPAALVVFSHYFLGNIVLTFLFLFTLIGSSFMRGTDKEIFDALVIVAVAAFFKGYRKTIILTATILVPLFLFLFIERKLGRRETIPDCLYVVCMNYDSYLAMISPKLEFGMAMITFYVTNGYQGLSVALGVPFEFHYGLGHLPPIEALACRVTGFWCDISSYNDRITAAGWNASTRWTTVFPTLANDLHFLFIPAYMFVLGIIMRSAENFWRDERNPVALATLIMFAIFFAYSSANMQVAISLDFAVAWIVLVYLPVLTLRVRRRSDARDAGQAGNGSDRPLAAEAREK